MPPAYINENTHWWDGSQIYGRDIPFADGLRSREHGKLRIDEHGLRTQRFAEPDVEQHPPGGLARGHRVRRVVDEEQVGQDDRDQTTDGGRPEPQGNVHTVSFRRRSFGRRRAARGLSRRRGQNVQRRSRSTGDTGYLPDRADTVLTMSP